MFHCVVWEVALGRAHFPAGRDASSDALSCIRAIHMHNDIASGDGWDKGSNGLSRYYGDVGFSFL